MLDDGGIAFHLGFELGRDATLRRIARRARRGADRDRRLQGARDRSAGRRASAGIVPALDYLIASNRKGLGDAVPEFDSGALDADGKNVVVIGGGDTAMDCVRTADAPGREIGEMPLSPRPRQHAGLAARSRQRRRRRRRVRMADRARSVPRRRRLSKACASRACAWACPMRRAARCRRKSRARISRCTPISSIKALGFDPEDLPALFGAPELDVTRWGTLKIEPATLDDQSRRRVRGRRHRARRIAGRVGDPRRPRCGRAAIHSISRRAKPRPPRWKRRSDDDETISTPTSKSRASSPMREAGRRHATIRRTGT